MLLYPLLVRRQRNFADLSCVPHLFTGAIIAGSRFSFTIIMYVVDKVVELFRHGNRWLTVQLVGSNEEKCFSINVRELMAIYSILQSSYMPQDAEDQQ